MSCGRQRTPATSISAVFALRGRGPKKLVRVARGQAGDEGRAPGCVGPTRGPDGWAHLTLIAPLGVGAGVYRVGGADAA